MLLIFTYDTKTWGGNLKSSQWKALEKGMKMHTMFYVKVRSSTTYRILLAKFGEIP